jgi:hypothetical protein
MVPLDDQRLVGNIVPNIRILLFACQHPESSTWKSVYVIAVELEVGVDGVETGRRLSREGDVARRGVERRGGWARDGRVGSVEGKSLWDDLLSDLEKRN